MHQHNHVTEFMSYEKLAFPASMDMESVPQKYVVTSMVICLFCLYVWLYMSEVHQNYWCKG